MAAESDPVASLLSPSSARTLELQEIFFGPDSEDDDVPLDELRTLQGYVEEYEETPLADLRTVREDVLAEEDIGAVDSDLGGAADTDPATAGLEGTVDPPGDEFEVGDGVAGHEWNWALGDIDRQDYNFQGRRGFGPGVDLPDDPCVSDFVEIFIQEEDFLSVQEETNRYAAQFLDGRELPAYSRYNKWPQEGVSVEDMKCFLALTVAMGLVVQEDIADYWSTDPLLRTPFFSEVMTRDYFLNILSFLHLANNDTYIRRGQDGYEPTQKLGTIYANIVSRFTTAWCPGQALCIDEGLVPYRGRIHFRVYNPAKPHKYGIKSYQICDSDNNYCLCFELYTGVSSGEVSAKGKIYDLVIRLMEPFFFKNHILFMDNYYSSPTLFMDLMTEKETGATGTARFRKGFPSQVKEARLKNRGDSLAMSDGPLLCVKVKDRKDVSFLSTVHSMAPVATGKRERDGTPVMRPLLIHQYNQKMGAVDCSDQMNQYSCFRRRSVKWWKTVFFHVFSLALLNAYILYKEWCSTKNKKPINQRTFRRNYAKELISTVQQLPSATKRPGRRPECAASLVRIAPHNPRKITRPGSIKKVCRQCVVCNNAERQMQRAGDKPFRRETTLECDQCEKALCAWPCFRLYHNYVDHVTAYKRWKRTEE